MATEADPQPCCSSSLSCAPSGVGVNPLTLPPVVKTVFQFLPGKTLSRAARVCRLWRSHTETCLRKRKQYCWQFFENNYDIVMEKMKQYFKEEIQFRPSVVVVFMVQELWQELHTQKLGGKRKAGEHQNRIEWRRFCRSILPKSCQVFCCVTTGIVGTSSDLSCTTEKENGISASILCFGQYPGLQVGLGKNVELFHTFFNQPVKQRDEKDLKMVVAMSYYSMGSTKIDDLRKYLPQTLVVGGVVEAFCLWGDINLNDKAFVRAVPCCILFQGRDVQVACVKLDQRVDTEDKAEEAVKKLKAKAKDFPMQHSIGFMFACVARGTSVYHKRDVEASLFRKHFPRTPLLGFFGNGEIGCEFPPPTEGGAKGVGRRLQHSYTTFLVVVSLPPV
ncbi:hypothetical protein ACOMHN_006962 [Nucella lapillus]